MLLLTISLVLIIIAVYAIYRHFKSRSVNTLDAGRRNKSASFATLPSVHSVQLIPLFTFRQSTRRTRQLFHRSGRANC